MDRLCSVATYDLVVSGRNSSWKLQQWSITEQYKKSTSVVKYEMYSTAMTSQRTGVSTPKSWISLINSVGDQSWAPSSSSPVVWHGDVGESWQTSMHLLTVSSAMCRYVVHFPPATNAATRNVLEYDSKLSCWRAVQWWGNGLACVQV